MTRLAEAPRIAPKWIVMKGVVHLIAALASAQYDLPPCELTKRFPKVRGTWVEARDTDSTAGYDEATCPDFVYLTDCLRQSKDRQHTLVKYRCVTTSGKGMLPRRCKGAMCDNPACLNS